MSWTESFLTTKLKFAKVNIGQKLLLEKDEYLKKLVDFDYQIRLGCQEQVTQLDYYKLIYNSVQEWEDDEISVICREYQKQSDKLKTFNLKWPDTIHFVKTDGSEESGAAYCRGTNIIVLSQKHVDRIVTQMRPQTLWHELWHVLSRNNPEKREQLYQALGFTYMKEFEIPEFLINHRITNPDAVNFDVVMQVETEENGPANVVPVCYYAKDEVVEDESFFPFYVAELLVVEETEPGSNCWRAQTDPYDELQLIPPKDCQSFWDQIGENTNYINHPEEIWAENFMELMCNPNLEGLPSPEIVKEMIKILIRPIDFLEKSMAKIDFLEKSTAKTGPSGEPRD